MHEINLDCIADLEHLPFAELIAMQRYAVSMYTELGKFSTTSSWSLYSQDYDKYYHYQRILQKEIDRRFSYVCEL